jgi:malonate transporter
MLDPVLLLPDFLLIMTGFLLCRYTAFDRPVWDVVERLVYWMLFPALLFASIVKSPIRISDASTLAMGGASICLVGMILATALRWVPGVDARLQASGAQVAFRFNSYIALALADRLYGSQGVAWIAVLIAVCVPLCNAGAVWSLARHGGQNTWKEMARNPLIIGTLAGLLVKLSGLSLPGWSVETISRIGQAALPMGLLAVGAGLKMAGIRAAPGLAAALLLIRHGILPLMAIVLGGLLPMSATQHGILVAFASLPTASSAYVLAMRMGGNGPFVAGLITVSTLLGMISVPLWVAAFQQWHGT